MYAKYMYPNMNKSIVSCVCVCVCMYVCIYIYIYTHVRVRVRVSLSATTVLETRSTEMKEIQKQSLLIHTGKPGVTHIAQGHLDI